MIAAPLTAIGTSIAARLGTVPRSLRSLCSKLKHDTSAVAFVEFAFTAPIVLGLGMLGTETAYFVITHMKVSQIAMQVADNAARLGEDEVLNAPRIYEADINETFIGAEKVGQSIEIFKHGRIILSSLQRETNRPVQFISWERCRGAKEYYPQAPVRGTGTQIFGMGNPDKPITASPGTAVMFVEVAYDYQSLTPFDMFDGRQIVYTAAFNIRDNRDLGGLYQRDTSNPDPVANCWTFSEDRPTL
jgi:hypothetical protein